MPELPEVETTRRGITAVMGHKVTNVIVTDRRLRWAIPPLRAATCGGTVAGTRRRAVFIDRLRFGLPTRAFGYVWIVTNGRS